MSWTDKVGNELIVITGDKKTFRPISINHSKSFDWNSTQFDFVDIDGSLVKRKKRKARKFPIEWYFTGEDNIDVATDFEESSKDERAWTIVHPYYGTLIVQPIELNFDNSEHNVTKITGTVLETITEDNPKTTIEPVDKIIADKATTDEAFAQSFANDVIPSVSDKNSLTANNTNLYNQGAKTITNTVDAENYFNLFNTANSKIVNATGKPLEAIRAAQAAISYPYLFVDTVKNRINLLVGQFNKLRESLVNITTKSGKKIYENNSAAVISTMAAAAATPQGNDYGSRNDVLQIATPINDAYNQYLLDLDSIKSDNGGSPDSYIPDADSLIALNDLMNFTLSNLFNIALGAKQERSIILEDDTNLILLTHRFYGLDSDDANMDKMISQNNIGINELIQIHKGRKIIYYV